MTTPVPNQPLISIDPISGDSRSSCASPFTSLSSIDWIPGHVLEQLGELLHLLWRHTPVGLAASRRAVRIT